MKANAGAIRLSATDLSNHLACRHLTALDLAVAAGERPASTWHSPDAWVLQQRGMEHEKAYLSHLMAEGVSICDLRDVDNDNDAFMKTITAMEQGVDAIAQATLANGRWFGRADVLRKVARPSKLGSWSYEVYDCKLARETKAATILQLSMYSEMLESVQGVLPESMYVVPPGESFHAEEHRVLDYAALCRVLPLREVPAGNSRQPSSQSYRHVPGANTTLRRMQLAAGLRCGAQEG